MGIKLANTKVSMDFPYEDENGKQYDIKYYYDNESNAYFISISDTLGKSSAFPVSPLVDVVDFLKNRGLVGSLESVANSIASGKGSVKTSQSLLPIPQSDKPVLSKKADNVNVIHSFSSPKKTKEKEEVIETNEVELSSKVPDKISKEDIIKERKSKMRSKVSNGIQSKGDSGKNFRRT